MTLLLCAGVILGAAGCGDNGPGLGPETEEPGYKDGRRLEKDDRPDQALASFLKVIVKREDQAPESHLEAGLIYLVHVKDPIEAIHHFRKFLEYEPNSKQATQVRGLIDEANRDYASTLPLHPLDAQGHPELADQLRSLHSENEELRAEILALRNGGSEPSSQPLFSLPGAATAPSTPPPPVEIQPEAGAPSAQSPAPPAAEPAVVVAADAPVAELPDSLRSPPPAAAAVRTHTVARGDTLWNLAIKFYGSGAKRSVILEANRDQLSGDNPTLKLGMVLKIPDAR